MAHRNGHWKRHATAPCIHILPKEPELLAILKVYVWTFMIVNSAYKTPFFRSSGSDCSFGSSGVIIPQSGHRAACSTFSWLIIIAADQSSSCWGDDLKLEELQHTTLEQYLSHIWAIYLHDIRWFLPERSPCWVRNIKRPQLISPKPRVELLRLLWRNSI